MDQGAVELRREGGPEQMRMHPAGAAAGGARRSVRAVARANIILGLAMAAIALVAATMFKPSDFHAKIIEQAAPVLDPGAQRCAATEAEVLDLFEGALDLVLMGVVQAVLTAAADVAVAGSLRMMGRWLTAPLQIIGAINACTFCYVVTRAAVVAIGHCASQYPVGDFITAGYVFFAVSYAVLLGVSLAATFYY